MKPFITETENATVIVIPKGEMAATPELSTHGTYAWLGETRDLPKNVIRAAGMWKEGKTAGEMSDALKLSPRKNDTDTGQRLLGAIRIVLPGLLPPRITPRRKNGGS